MNRRTFLSTAPAVVAALPAKAELPADKCHRLMGEIADLLPQVFAGKFTAVIKPNGETWFQRWRPE